MCLWTDCVHMEESSNKFRQQPALEEEAPSIQTVCPANQKKLSVYRTKKCSRAQTFTKLNFPVAVRRFGDELIFQMSALKPKGTDNDIMDFFYCCFYLFSFSSVWLFLISVSDCKNLNTQQCVGLPCQQTKLSSHVNPTIQANRDV